PELLGQIQEVVGKEVGKDKPFDLVFHGGSGSSEEEIATAVRHGGIKMNIDTDTQYSFTRAGAEHMFRSYDGVLKVDGDVGVKKQYDPGAWGKSAEDLIAKRIVEACEQLGSAGNKMSQAAHPRSKRVLCRFLSGTNGIRPFSFAWGRAVPFGSGPQLW